MLVLLAVTHQDTEQDAQWLAQKLAGLRIFQDSAGKMNLSLLDIGGEALVVSQFTLYGSTRKGRRPSFVASARPEQAEPLYELFCDLLAAQGPPVSRGVFGAMMSVSLVNDGPVTLIVDTP
jgi:D-tyrosyl-tRNA(Tyr) deacylase